MRYCRNKEVPVFITNKDELSTSDIITLMYEIEKFDNKYKTNSDYYYGKHAILNRTFDDTSKPNNKVVTNIPKYITQVRTGYFSSAPMSMDSINESYISDVRTILDNNDFKHIFSQLDTYCSIYGHAFLVMYLDDNGEIRIRPQKPTEWIMVYDNSLEQKPKFAIRYYCWLDDIDNQQMYDIELWTDKEIIVYEGSPMTLQEVSRRDHYFGRLPVIEFMENESRHGAYEDVINLIDCYELMLSDTANTVSYFSDCYLILEGMDQTDPEEIDKFKDQFDERENKILKLTMLFHDFGKPSCRTTDENQTDHFKQHPEASEKIAVNIMRRLKLDNDTIENVRTLVRLHDLRPKLTDESVRRLIVMVGLSRMEMMLKVRTADMLSQSEYLREEKLLYIAELEKKYREIILRKDCLSIKDLQIKGRDLINSGIKEGPILGEILKALLDDVLITPSHNNYDYLLEKALQIEKDLR